MKNKVLLINDSLRSFSESLEIQKKLHARCVRGEIPAAVLMTQHPPVVTLGKNASLDHLLHSSEYFTERGVEIIRCDRGGEATAHMPGQLVIYPILPLRSFGITPKSYVCLLEQTAIAVLAALGVSAHIDAPYPGVWVGSDKICAVGVRIKDRVTMHGMSFNISNNLEIFKMIIPCGIENRGVCNLNQLITDPVDVEFVKASFLKVFFHKLDAEVSEVSLDQVLSTDPKRS